MPTASIRTLGALTLSFVLLVSGQAHAGEAEWKAHMDAGMSAYRAGDHRAAAARFDAALKEAESIGVPDPILAATLVSVAMVYKRQGRYGQAEPLYLRSLAIIEKTLGLDHQGVATTLHDLGELYDAQGRFAEAEPLYLRSLGIRASALGTDHPQVRTSLNDLARMYHAQARYAEAELAFRRSLELHEKALGPDHPDVGTALSNLALSYAMQLRYAEAEPLYRRSLEIQEKALGPDHPRVATTLSNIASLYHHQMRYADAEPLYRRVQVIFEKALGSDHPDVGTALNNLAVLYVSQWRLAEAERLFRRALELYEKALGPDHPDVARSLNSLAEMYRDQGRHAEAAPLYRRALGIREKNLGPDHPDVGQSLNNLAVLYKTQGRYAEAEPLYRRAPEITEKALGLDHPDTGATLDNLAQLYQAQGLLIEAEPLYRRALAVRENALGKDHPSVATTLNNLAGLYRTQRRYAEAEPLNRHSLEINEKTLGPDHPDTGVALQNVALLYRLQARYAEAQSLYLRSLRILEEARPPDHPDVARALINLAEMNQAQGKVDEALAFARRATSALALRFAANSGASRRDTLGERGTYSTSFEFHVSLLTAIAEHRPQARAEAAREGFGIAQLARASDTAEQVAKMAARYAAGSDALARLARSRQDAIARLDQLDTRIVQSAGQRGNKAIAAKLRGEEVETRKSISELDARLEREYPQYQELINPEPLEHAAAQKLLAAEEAFVLLLVSEKESFLWVLRRAEAGFFKLALTRSELVEIVSKLRAQLDIGAAEPERILARPFDAAAAHGLYRKVLAPAEALLAGARHLIFVPDGAMQSLPPGVLVTEPPATPITSLADHAQVGWLAKKYAITVLPAAGSLRALRQFAKAPASREPFGGFGDPVLEGTGDARRTKVAALYSRGAVADANEVRKLAPLPESAGELRAIATALKAPAAAVRLGSEATERAVKEADLTRYRILAFATHGLMTGEFKGLAEPALVLTPPEKGNELDDGLLTAGEISQLKLDADWVVLSACNTAAPDGTPGAEGLSGLARAFFYAGARSLLVSHWSVSSDAAVALTTRMFDESSKGAPKAEALRRSMLALMESTGRPHFAHPAFWAPFVVVGEGNAEWNIGR